MIDLDQHPLLSPESADIHQVLTAIETHNKMDDLLDAFEEGASPEDIASTLDCSQLGVIHSLVMGYHWEGRTQHAEEIARLALEFSQQPVFHNDLLRVLLASASPSEEEYFQQTLAWSERYEKPFLSPSMWEGRQPPQNRRWRIGVLCDYGFSCIGIYGLQPMFLAMAEHMDLYYYNFGAHHGFVQNDGLQYLHVQGMSAEALDQRIRADKIDLLIDLNGRLRTQDRLDVVLRRPAPYQATWYNQMGTSGLSVMDWIIADQHVCPRADDRLFTEKVVRLREGTGCFVLPEDVPVTLPPSSRGRTFTFGSFHDGFKLNDRVLAAWCAILNEATHARLIIKSVRAQSARFQRRIADFFQRAGIASSRVKIELPSPFKQMLRDYNRIDLALDSFPYHGGTTNINALWQGIPVLSLVGNHWRSRNTWAQLMSTGLTDFVAYSEAQYIAKAVEISRNPSLLVDVRVHMRQRLQKSAFYNPAIFAKDFANALQALAVVPVATPVVTVVDPCQKIEIPPTFLIAGTQKGGTTALHQILATHPDLCGSNPKEIGYFFLDPLYSRGNEWYHQHFIGQAGQLAFEATPEYLCCPQAAERIARYRPEMKLIMVLRNPVERAFSAWNMHYRAAVHQDSEARPDLRTFEEAIGEELAAMQSGWVERLGEPLAPGCGTQLMDYVRRGIYVEQIERFLKYFPRQQLLILESQELKRNLPETLRTITDFLGVAPFAEIALPSEQRAAIASYDQQLSASTRNLLAAFYRPFNRKLYQLMGKTWDWDASV